MAWTDADVTTLRAAILTVATTGQRVQFGTRIVERANLKDMMELLASMEVEVSATTAAGYRFVAYDKGV